MHVIILNIYIHNHVIIFSLYKIAQIYSLLRLIVML
jgi:hypothetical protein